MNFNAFTSASDSDRKICMLIIGDGREALSVCVCARVIGVVISWRLK